MADDPFSDYWQFNIEHLAAAFRISEESVRELFHNGRFVSWLAEYWVRDAFKLSLYSNKNHASSDGYHALPDNSQVEHSIRVITARGIKFQASKNMGAGRSCTLNDLKDNIRKTERWIVVDVVQFPRITFYRLKCSVLERWIDNGELTTSGLPYNRFTLLCKRDRIPLVRLPRRF
jgi:hypothetical protein